MTEPLDLDQIDADIDEASGHIDHPDAPYNWPALQAMRTAEKLRREAGRLRDEQARWDQFVQDWHLEARVWLPKYQPHHRHPEQATPELLRSIMGQVHEDALAWQVLTGALDATMNESDHGDEADISIYLRHVQRLAELADGSRQEAAEALIDTLEVLAYDRGMDPTDRDPATYAFLPLADVVDTIRQWEGEPATPQRTAGGDWIEPVVRRYFDMNDPTQCGTAFAIIGALKAAAQLQDGPSVDRLAVEEEIDCDIDEALNCLAELVRLKDGPRGDEYERRKPGAWDRARIAIARLRPEA